MDVDLWLGCEIYDDSLSIFRASSDSCLDEAKEPNDKHLPFSERMLALFRLPQLEEMIKHVSRCANWERFGQGWQHTDTISHNSLTLCCTEEGRFYVKWTFLKEKKGCSSCLTELVGTQTHSCESFCTFPWKKRDNTNLTWWSKCPETESKRQGKRDQLMKRLRRGEKNKISVEIPLDISLLFSSLSFLIWVICHTQVSSRQLYRGTRQVSHLSR